LSSCLICILPVESLLRKSMDFVSHLGSCIVPVRSGNRVPHSLKIPYPGYLCISLYKGNSIGISFCRLALFYFNLLEEVPAITENTCRFPFCEALLQTPRHSCLRKGRPCNHQALFDRSCFRRQVS